jgi:hypothetical protein
VAAQNGRILGLAFLCDFCSIAYNRCRYCTFRILAGDSIHSLDGNAAGHTPKNSLLENTFDRFSTRADLSDQLGMLKLQESRTNQFFQNRRNSTGLDEFTTGQN